MESQGSVFGGGRPQISGGNFMSAAQIHLNQHITNNKGPESTEAFAKLTYNVAPSALHDSGEISDPPKCHPGTRVDILTVLITWALFSVYEFPIRWLNGPAGAGKSAIMRSFAEMLVEKGLLLASFFFFRSDRRRNTVQRLISTIAYQLCLKVPPLQPWVERAIEVNPLIFSASLSTQIQTLIVDPFLHYFYDPNSAIVSPFPRVIIVDGLDECSGDENQQEILHSFCRMVKTLPIPIAIVFASRPEHQIRITFELGSLSKVSSRIVLDKSFNPDKDIRHFYLSEFAKIRSTHPMCSYLGAIWPSEDVLRILIHNASGQFIYASTVIKFVKSNRHNPALRLQIVLGQIDRGRSKPFEQLDNLYSIIFLNVDPEVLPETLKVLGIFFTPGPEQGHQSPRFIESLLGFSTGHIRSILLDLESLLTVTDDENDIRIYHTSLSDFLFDNSRAGEFFIDRGLVYADIALSCISQSRHLQIITLSLLPRHLLHSYLEAQTLVSLQNATTNDNLHDAIVTYDIPQFKGVSNCHLALLFLAGVKGLNFPGANNLFQTKLCSFGRHINAELIEHWLEHDCFWPSLLFISLLAVMPISPEEVIESITGLLNRPIMVFIHPNIFYKGQGHTIFRTSEECHLLAAVILDIIDTPTGLLHDPRGRHLCTDLAVHLVQEILPGQLLRPGPYMEQMEKILAFLLNVSLARDNLITAAKGARRAITDNSSSDLNIESLKVMDAALNSYIQRAKYEKISPVLWAVWRRWR